MSTFDRMRMDGKVAVVTGAGQGIGRAIATNLAAAGCDVVLNARRVTDLEVTAEQVRAEGRRALVVAGELISPARFARVSAAVAPIRKFPAAAPITETLVNVMPAMTTVCVSVSCAVAVSLDVPLT